MSIINNAYAQSPAVADGGMSMLIMVGLFFVIMYFMIIRPQNKRVKEHNKLIDSLSNGTEVVISNGIMGKIVKIKDDTVDLEISSNVIIKVRKSSVTTVLPKGSI
jgi:preprotein translocase subunit YajC|tara:strand:- start:850 stop:1164 length:315 start_codon:yes stop_codon:yes gene_type:complete